MKSDQALLHAARDQLTVAGVNRAARVPPCTFCSGTIERIQQPIIDVHGLVKPNTVIKAGYLHPVSIVTAPVGHARGPKERLI